MMRRFLFPLALAFTLLAAGSACALDTKQERGSAIEISLSFRVWLSEPSGTVDLSARQSLLKLPSTPSFSGWAPSLGDGYANSIDNLLNPSPSGSYVDLFSTFSLAADTSVYNANHWGGGGALVDWTSIGYRTTPSSTLYAKLVAITPRHAISTQHTAVSADVGEVYTWITSAGVRVSRTITGTQTFVSNGIDTNSFHIVYLDEDLPGTIDNAPVFTDRAASMIGLPAALVNQMHQCHVANISANGETASYIDPASGTRDLYFTDWIGNDSGSPAFVLIGAQPIYVTSATSVNNGPNISTRTAWIKQACDTLNLIDGTSYLPTFYGIENTAARRAATRRGINP